ncbi:hypothetical protein DXG01_012218 [Tephrocybe rancida]|nr:hypothetical protein DXG01_012218 [Tephrocybe rancida]
MASTTSSTSSTRSGSRTPSATPSISSTSSLASATTSTPTIPSFPPFTDPTTTTSTALGQGSGGNGGGGNGGGGGGGNGGPGVAASASLYLYTFLATLVLLLSVSAAIILRSLLLRRRHQRMVEEAIRNGTWVPPSPGGSGPFGLGGGGRRVDLTKKPKLWEAYVGDRESPAQKPRQAETTTEWEWESIRPFAAAYVVPTTAGNDAASTTSTAPSGPPSLSGRVRNLFRRSRTPTPPSTPAEYPMTATGAVTPTTAAPLLEGTTAQPSAPTPVPQKVRVAVLIAMPHPPESKSRPSTPPVPVASTSAATIPARSQSATDDEEPELPHIEFGVAELDVSQLALQQGKGKETLNVTRPPTLPRSLPYWLPEPAVAVDDPADLLDNAQYHQPATVSHAAYITIFRVGDAACWRNREQLLVPAAVPRAVMRATGAHPSSPRCSIDAVGMSTLCLSPIFLLFLGETRNTTAAAPPSPEITHLISIFASRNETHTHVMRGLLLDYPHLFRGIKDEEMFVSLQEKAQLSTNRMRLSTIIGLAALAHSASAHYIWYKLTAGGAETTAAIRQPLNNSPVDSDVTSKSMTCNATPTPATETVTVAAGSTVGFTLDNTLYHQGPAAIYLGKAPSTAGAWDGSGANWFKIAEWGATFNPFGFVDFNLSYLETTIPANTPAGEYLLRIESIGLHVAGAPQYYISCAQIKVTGGGSGNPSKVSIPGYVTPDDPSLTVNIYYPIPTSYTVRDRFGAFVPLSLTDMASPGSGPRRLEGIDTRHRLTVSHYDLRLFSATYYNAVTTDIWFDLIAGSTTSTAAVRQPLSNSPVTSVTSNDIRCNTNPTPATETVSVAAGSTIGFKLDNTIYHLGPAAIYLGKAPSTAASWDGSGANWFKIAEWGATFSPSFSFTSLNANQLTTTIPSSTPAGEYLVRIEQVGLHVVGAPQWYISCAQIKITGGGSGNPSKVSLPGYVSATGTPTFFTSAYNPDQTQKPDPGLTVDIYYPVPTAYKVPGPSVWRG